MTMKNNGYNRNRGEKEADREKKHAQDQERKRMLPGKPEQAGEAENHKTLNEEQ